MSRVIVVLARWTFLFLTATHLIDAYSRHYCRKALKAGRFPTKFGTEAGAFRCPGCKRQYITAYPVRDSLLEHLEECEYV